MTCQEEKTEEEQEAIPSRPVSILNKAGDERSHRQPFSQQGISDDKSC